MKLMQVMKDMIDTGELTFTPDGGAILRYPPRAKTSSTLFFSFSPGSKTDSGEQEEIFPIGNDTGVLPQLYGTLYDKGFLTGNTVWKMPDICGQRLN